MSTKHRISILIFLVFLINLSLSIVDRTYFNYLGLKITASKQQVQQAYQTKLSKLEGLENMEQKNRKLTLLQSAYKTLINEKQRQKYERYGKDAFKNIKQITSVNQYTGSDSRKGPTLNMKIPVSIEDLYNGTTVKAQFQTQEACTKCTGTGADSPKHLKPCTTCTGKGFSVIDGMNKFGQPHKFQGICPHCQGSGKLVTKHCDACHGKKIINTLKTVDIKIPPKFQGKQLRLKNYGPQQELGAPSDFLVQIQQIPGGTWKRNGQHLFHTLQISLEQSILGFTKTVTHLSGQQIVIERREITTKQTKITHQGKGYSEKGRLTVDFKIKIPHFTDRQLDMWEDFFKKYDNL